MGVGITIAITVAMTTRNCLACHGRSPFADDYD